MQLTSAYRPANPFRNIFILGLIILAGILTLAAVASHVGSASHAVAKHGSPSAEHARQCSSENNVFETWYRMASLFRRPTYMEVCEYNDLDKLSDDKTWTMRVVDKVTGDEITVFTHTGGYQSLEEYLLRQMYNFLQ